MNYLRVSHRFFFNTCFTLYFICIICFFFYQRHRAVKLRSPIWISNWLCVIGEAYLLVFRSTVCFVCLNPKLKIRYLYIEDQHLFGHTLESLCHYILWVRQLGIIDRINIINYHQYFISVMRFFILFF